MKTRWFADRSIVETNDEGLSQGRSCCAQGEAIMRYKLMLPAKRTCAFGFLASHQEGMMNGSPSCLEALREAGRAGIGARS